MNILQSFNLSLTLLFFAGAQASAPANPSDAGMKVVMQNGKIVLRNDTLASSSRIEEVWQSLQKIDTDSIHDERFWLWRTCLVAKKRNASLCDVRALDHKKEYLKPLNEESIQKFDGLAITRNGIIDEETQNIVLSSYSGSIDGKIVNKHYPIKSWYESIPGYGIRRLLFGWKK